MSTIVTRAGKGSPLTHNEVDANFTNLNTDKVEKSGSTLTGTLTCTSVVMSGNLSVNGNSTFGDASGDSVTFNASTASTPNGLNFDSNTLVIDATNDRIGIGTSSPGAKLDIGAGNLTFSGTGQRITGDFSNATQASRVLFQSSTVNGLTNIGLLPNGTSTTTAFTAFSGTDPANASVMQINTDGSLGVVNSGKTGTGTYLPMVFNTGGAERMRIDSSGNVGIGTSSPTDKLQINLQDGVRLGASGSTSYVRIGSATTGEANSQIAFDRTVGAITIGQGTVGSAFTERMRIDSSGNVGIGTSSPSTKVMISGASETTSAPTDAGTKASTLLAMGGSEGIGAGGTVAFGAFGKTFAAIKGFINDANLNGTGALCFSTRNAVSDTSLTERMRIDVLGNVGIGTSSPSTRLDVDGQASTFIRVGSTAPSSLYINNAGTYGFIYTNESIPLIWGTAATERMRINSAGLVGIGTTAPSALLTLAAGTATANTGPLKFTSGTNLSTPEAGAVEYDGTIMTATSNTNFKRGTIPLTNYTSGVGTSLTATSESTLQVLLPSANDTITLSAGTYFLDLACTFTRGTTSTTSATARINLLGTGNAAGNFSGMALSSATAGAATSNFSFSAVNINTSNVVTAASTSASGVYTITLRGMLKITTGGTIIPQYNLSANLTSAGTATAPSVLYFRLQQIDTQSAAAFGPAGTGWG